MVYDVLYRSINGYSVVMGIRLNTKKIILISSLMFFITYSFIIVFADVAMEEGLYARYSFEVFNWYTSIYDTQNQAERLVKYGNPTVHYSNVTGIGKYAYFDGDDYYKDAGDDGIISSSGSQKVHELTICTVAKAVYDTEQLRYFTISEYGRDGFYFDWSKNNNQSILVLRDSTGVYTNYWAGQECNTTGWTLFTASYLSGDEGFVRLWYNSTLIKQFNGTVETPILLPQMENRFSIGRQQWNGYYAEGYLGFVEVYTIRLDTEWVTEKYNSVFGIDVNVTSAWEDMSDMLFEELLFGTGFWFGLLLIIAILQIVSYMVPSFSGLGGVFSLLLFIAYILNMDLDGFHTFGIILMAINGVYLLLQAND